MKINNDIITEDEVLEVARDFCEKSGMKLSTLGRKALNNSKIFERLGEDKTITISSLKKLFDFMRDYPDFENKETTP